MPADNCGSTKHGEEESRFGYEERYVDYGQGCKQGLQTRLCSNGQFEAWQIGIYPELECDSRAATNCQGALHNEVKTRDGFKVANVPFGETCEAGFQTSLCVNGSFLPWAGGYPALSCSVSEPLNCSTLDHNESITRKRFLKSAPSFNEACLSEIQTKSCFNGLESGWVSQNNYSELTCDPQTPKKCGTTEHDGFDSKDFFSTPYVAYGNTCPKQTRHRKCFNGQLLSYDGDASYSFTSCKKGTQEDIDSDGVSNAIDNCPSDYNPQQNDTDLNNIGNTCDKKFKKTLFFDND